MDLNGKYTWVAGLVMAALAACSSTDMNRDTSSSTTPDAASTTSGTAATSSSNTGSTSSSVATPQISYGTVQMIEPMLRQDVGVGAVGAAAAGGSLGSPTDKVYRVTAKMDDGSSQIVVLDTMPSYKAGDRVRYSNGTLQQY